MKLLCDACGNPRTPGQGDKNTCATCYARRRRLKKGLPVRPRTSDSGHLTENFQLAITPQMKAELWTAFPVPYERAEWARHQLKMALEILAVRKKLGLGP